MMEPKVSIICNTYNQEKYIRDALEGFVTQKTDFDFEVLVHDDASTDNTPQIVKEYELKYPELIKPIYETENQYSKFDGSLKRIQFSRVQGKYIAYCEGDDYWIDDHKLQKQYDYMESHPECTICFTNGLNKYGDRIANKVVPDNFEAKKIIKDKDSDYYLNDMILIDYVPTASLFIRFSDYKDAPAVPADAFSGDTYTRLYSTSRGHAHYINDVTCIYNRGVPKSVTTLWMENSDEYRRFVIRHNRLYDFLDSITDLSCHDAFNKAKDISWYRFHLSTFDRNELSDKKYLKIAKDGGIKEILKYYCVLLFPGIAKLLYRYKHR